MPLGRVSAGRYLPDDEKRVLQNAGPVASIWIRPMERTLLARATMLPADFIWKVLRIMAFNFSGGGVGV